MWIIGFIAALIAIIVINVTYYYHEKDSRQAARGKVNIDLICEVKAKDTTRE